MHLLMTRYFLSLGNVAFSMVLGVVALAACAIYNAPLLNVMIRHAGSVREWVVSISGSPNMELISRFVLHDSSILLMFFTLMARVVVGMLTAIISSVFLSSDAEVDKSFAAQLHKDSAPKSGEDWQVIRLLGNATTFVLGYVVVMLPTYALPYLGSNSSIFNIAGSHAGIGVSPGFWIHFICLLVLVFLTAIRGVYINRVWLVIFPFLALVFDLTPTLNAVPMVPTGMHLLAIILGVALGKPTPGKLALN